MRSKKIFKVIEILLIIFIVLSIIGFAVFSYYYLFRNPGYGYIKIDDINSISIVGFSDGKYVTYVISSILQIIILLVLTKIFDNLSKAKIFVKENVLFAQVFAFLIFVFGFLYTTEVPTIANVPSFVNYIIGAKIFGRNSGNEYNLYMIQRIFYCTLIALVVWGLSKILENAIKIAQENEYTI